MEHPQFMAQNTKVACMQLHKRLHFIVFPGKIIHKRLQFNVFPSKIIHKRFNSTFSGKSAQIWKTMYKFYSKYISYVVWNSEENIFPKWVSEQSQTRCMDVYGENKHLIPWHLPLLLKCIYKKSGCFSAFCWFESLLTLQNSSCVNDILCKRHFQTHVQARYRCEQASKTQRTHSSTYSCHWDT